MNLGDTGEGANVLAILPGGYYQIGDIGAESFAFCAELFQVTREQFRVHGECVETVVDVSFWRLLFLVSFCADLLSQIIAGRASSGKRFLLRHAMQRPESQHQIGTGNLHYFTIGIQIGYYVQCHPIVRIFECWH